MARMILAANGGLSEAEWRGGHLAEVLCAIDVEDPTAVFITIYWED